MTILMLYPFKLFQKMLNALPIRWYILHTFVDSLQKDVIRMEQNQVLVIVDGFLLYFLFFGYY